MHMVCVTLRLQDLSPKIRAKMSIIMARVSLDDYQLKVRNLLRNSKYRNDIISLEKGKFVFPEDDTILETKPFVANGKLFEWIPKIPEKPKPKSTWQLIKEWWNRKPQPQGEGESMEYCRLCDKPINQETAIEYDGLCQNCHDSEEELDFPIVDDWE